MVKYERFPFLCYAHEHCFAVINIHLSSITPGYYLPEIIIYPDLILSSINLFVQFTVISVQSDRNRTIGDNVIDKNQEKKTPKDRPPKNTRINRKCKEQELFNATSW